MIHISAAVKAKTNRLRDEEPVTKFSIDGLFGQDFRWMSGGATQLVTTIPIHPYRLAIIQFNQRAVAILSRKITQILWPKKRSVQQEVAMLILCRRLHVFFVNDCMVIRFHAVKQTCVPIRAISFRDRVGRAPPVIKLMTS